MQKGSRTPSQASQRSHSGRTPQFQLEQIQAVIEEVAAEHVAEVPSEEPRPLSVTSAQSHQEYFHSTFARQLVRLQKLHHLSLINGLISKEGAVNRGQYRRHRREPGSKKSPPACRYDEGLKDTSLLQQDAKPTRLHQ